MTAITAAERTALVDAAKRYITLDERGEIVGGFQPAWRAFQVARGLSDYRAKSTVAKAARLLRGETVQLGPGRPVTLDGSAVRLSVWLEPAHVETANLLGDGNTSAGVRLALDEATERRAAKARNDKLSAALNAALT